MSINFSPRGFRVTIGSMVWTDGAVTFDGADSKLPPAEGTVIFRGKFLLGRPHGFETLDDRKNKRWNRGTPIVLEFKNDAGIYLRSPRGGALFILSSAYDFKARLLTLEVGDIFALLSFKEGKGDKSGICIGEAESNQSVINKLLLAAGSPLLIDPIPGEMRVPQPKLLEGSYIQQAGLIAAREGYFLFVDSLNQVRAKKLNPDEPIAVITIDLTGESTDLKRLSGESPAQYVYVRMQVQISRSNAGETIIESEVYGPAAVAGLATSSFIVIRKERRVEKLVANTRVVTTLVYEPAGAIIQKLTGDCGLITSYDNLETFVYETDAQVKANPLAPKCETGNQARLLTRELLSYRPYGAVLPTVAASFPDNVFVAQVPLILDTHEIETFTYDKPSDVVNPNEPIYDALEDVAPQSAKLYGLTHELKRWEPRGKVSPEDYLYEPDNNYWINADELGETFSFQLTKQWKEQRSDEWIYTENEYNAIARAYPDAAARLRQKFKDNNTTYTRNIFTNAIPIRNETRTSSNGNTQPPSPDTMPSKVITENATITGKASFPIDTDYEFRQKPLEISFQADLPSGDKAAVDAIRAKANQLAAVWGKVSWGRFKGISLQTAFTQQWWNYTPFDRIDILETFPGVEYANVETSAYLGDGFAIAIAQKDSFIGIDGVFLGFKKSAQLIPPYKQVFITDSQIGLQSTYTTTQKETGTLAITYNSQIGIMVSFRSPINAPSNVVALGSNTTPYNLSIAWNAPLSDVGAAVTVAGYEVEYRLGSGVYQGNKLVTGLDTIFTGLAVGSYQARVRSVSPNGRKSDWTESNVTNITQVSTILTVSASATTTSPPEGSTVTLSSAVTGLGTFSNAVTWSVQPSSTSIGIVTVQGSTVTYTVPSGSAGLLSRLRATSDQDNTKFGEVVLNIQASLAPSPGTIPWRSVGSTATLLNSDRVYVGTAGITTLTLPTNAPLWSDITIVNNGASTGFAIVPSVGISIVFEGVTQSAPLKITDNSASIRLLCTSAPSTWVVIEYIGSFAFDASESLAFNLGWSLPIEFDVTIAPNIDAELVVELDWSLPIEFDVVGPSYTQVMSYTITHQKGPGQPIISTGTWTNLNDNNNETGVFVDSGTFSRVVINLGSALNIQEIRLDGGFIGGFDLATNMNGLDLQYSASFTGPWTSYTVVSGISDFGPPVVYYPNITAQYWRLSDETNNILAACTSMFEFYI
jgi:hypothetical protein